MTTQLDTIMEAESPVTMLATTDTMSQWSDEKKKEFADLFSKRTTLAKVLCEITVSKFANMAANRHFISQYHLTKLKRSHGWTPDREYKWEYSDTIKSCGRDPDEVMRIADNRAKAMLRELPPLKDAVQVIDKETAKRIDKIAKLQAKAEKLGEEIEQLPRTLNMNDDEFQDMKVSEFRAHAKALYTKRKKMLDTINKCGQEAHDLEITVAKALYKGLPGLSDAVLDVIRAHIERATGLDQMNRRVGEQVRFGDSEAATGLLKQFEQDEANVSDELKGKLNAAMATLKASVKANKKKVAAKKKAKALPAKKKATKKTSSRRAR